MFVTALRKRGLTLAKIRGASRALNADASVMKKNKSNLPLKTLAKILLIASPVLFAVSLTGPGSEFLWGFLKPLSALLFVNFFIMNLLAKEYASYDAEYELRLALAARNLPQPAESPRQGPRVSSVTQPTFAH